MKQSLTWYARQHFVQASISGRTFVSRVLTQDRIRSIRAGMSPTASHTVTATPLAGRSVELFGAFEAITH